MNLHTVCEEAMCPNVHECWGGGTATIMIMGDTCTRGCRFCAVRTGDPQGRLDPLEPASVAAAVARWGLRHVVLTSVNRDDLPDGGAAHFAETVAAVKRRSGAMVEVLIPDFLGDLDAVRRVLDAGPDVMAHNVETVERLTPAVRDPSAAYRQSLRVLRGIKAMDPGMYTKSSIMVGLGETREELEQTFRDLREAGVDILTLGQYLQPTKRHLDVVEYVEPGRFDLLREVAESHGFLYVASGPLVRSSYRAGELFMEGVLRSGAPPERREAVAGGC
jgi:lipoic acid synthetase